MNEKTDLTPWHLSTIIERSRLILRHIEGITDLYTITRTLNDRGYIMQPIHKEPSDVCSFLFDSGHVYLKVFQPPGVTDHAWYVEILSKESIKIA